MKYVIVIFKYAGPHLKRKTSNIITFTSPMISSKMWYKEIDR